MSESSERAVPIEVESAPEEEQTSQSGLRVAPPLSARIEAALAAGARTDTALADVFRTTKFLCATVSALRESNAGLIRELQSLSEILSDRTEAHGAMTGRVTRLEPVTDDAGTGTVLERERLIAEHDRFIAMLLADHERELEALRSSLSPAEPIAKPQEKA